ncbi:MAG: alanine--glyoxylate aminotransferase family protein [Clostridiales bacterium]|nr:alanine--glyoxylate aminotransferase family protein [Clostridiales bacterium]MCF8021522.1 alanine--glyoxylate aminotransferase family protein [Clostridiales bacterium]
MPQKEYLMIPGPTPVPPMVMNAMSQPMFGHRSPEFAEIHKNIIEKLKLVFQTQNDVFVLSSSGTGGMEAAVANIINPGEKVLVLVGGKFGERWSELSYNYGAQVIQQDFTWGEPVDINVVKKELANNPDIKAVFATFNETSTGVFNDIEKLGKAVSNTNALLILDGISGAGGIEIKTDEWNVDILVTGSQKAFMLPPGLAMISVSSKAWEKIKNKKSPCYYFDLLKTRKSMEKYNTAYTPAVSLFLGLNASLDLIIEEGVNNVFQRHIQLRNATRAAIDAMGLKLMTENYCASPVITSIYAPKNIGADDLRKVLKQQYNISFAGGQAQLKNKIFRIAHMGFADKMDVITAISGLEMALNNLNSPVELGSGLKAAQEVFLGRHK